MCGIVGYIGDRDATAIIYDGLKRLEYRGYDSAGIALYNDQNGESEIELRRAVGKLDCLGEVLKVNPAHGRIGIGHTRWATHGKPTEANAHPHLDCTGNTVVIHNGIVENYLPLRRRLLDLGHRFDSETDTEVIVHLVEDHLKTGIPLEDAVRATLGEIRGNHAIVVFSKSNPDRLVTARLGNAGGVVLGVGQDEMFLASDLPAILEHTRDMVFLDDGDVAVITKNGYLLSRVDGAPVERAPQRVNWDPISAAKGGYKHFMLKEIFEQPRTVSDTISARIQQDPPDVFLSDLRLSDERLASFKRVVAVACGTAWHAGLVGKFMIEDLAHLPVEVDYADEFRYRDLLLDEETLFLAITQSGETVDLLVSMAEAKKLGVTTLGIVNVLGSQASRVADSLIYTHAGPEIGVASTKAFTSQLAALFLFALKLGKVRGVLSDETLRQKLQALAELPHLIGRILKDNVKLYEELAELLHDKTDFLYIARGINYPIALEGALKLKEISYIHAEGYPAGEMKHGPIALLDKDMPVVAVVTHDRVYEKTVSNIQQVKARNGMVIAIANEGDTLIPTIADYIISVPETDPHLAPILNVIPTQLLAYYLAIRRGTDVDQPRNLAKSVTVE